MDKRELFNQMQQAENGILAEAYTLWVSMKEVFGPVKISHLEDKTGKIYWTQKIIDN